MDEQLSGLAQNLGVMAKGLGLELSAEELNQIASFMFELNSQIGPVSIMEGTAFTNASLQTFAEHGISDNTKEILRDFAKKTFS